MRGPGTPGLVASGLVAGWGPAPVLHGVDVTVAPGELVGLLGGNGSGKSTLLAVLAGLLRPQTGEVRLDGVRLTGRPAERVAAAGVRLLSQQRRVFGSLSVHENLLSPLLAGARPDGARVRAAAQEWYERFPMLARQQAVAAAALSGGQQQLVALGRVLAVPARVLLLDEPSAGLSAAAEDVVAGVLRERAAAGTGVLLVEQDVGFAARLAGRTLQLRAGRLG